MLLTLDLDLNLQLDRDHLLDLRQDLEPYLDLP
uniref:Uncharacterized protein n=1 Tax=Picea sitchensis TaxID=3332 RepID=A0A6B9XSG0_PICSI|nr:hypothetical protein Q903MT_gene3970 [Picea sitchensis]